MYKIGSDTPKWVFHRGVESTPHPRVTQRSQMPSLIGLRLGDVVFHTPISTLYATYQNQADNWTPHPIKRCPPPPHPSRSSSLQKHLKLKIILNYIRSSRNLPTIKIVLYPSSHWKVPWSLCSRGSPAPCCSPCPAGWSSQSLSWWPWPSRSIQATIHEASYWNTRWNHYKSKVKSPT